MFYNIKPGDLVTATTAPSECYVVEPFTWDLKCPKRTLIPCRNCALDNQTRCFYPTQLVVAPPKKPSPAIDVGDIVRIKHVYVSPGCPKPAELRVVAPRWRAHNPDESDVRCEWWAPDGIHHTQVIGWEYLEVVRRASQPLGLIRCNDVVVLKDGCPDAVYDVVETTTDMLTCRQTVTIRYRLNGYITRVDGSRVRVLEPGEFAAGDVVRLKSGGKSMTVDKAAEGRVQCSYFENGGLKFANFPFEMLEKV